jgi:acetyl-CoA carboxylase carboxyl transferase subunit alpha
LLSVSDPAAAAWAKVQLARHPQRPYTLDYVRAIFDDFVELHGDRMFADDAAIVGGPALLAGRAVMVIGHQKGRDTRENVRRHFGMSRPEGYRKARRLMLQAQKFRLPLLTFVDIPGADPSLASEERGQALAIAENLLEMSRLSVPSVATIVGEGGSGGALAIAVMDRVLMLENAIYSVVSPEGASTILWKDSGLASQAAASMKITAPDLLRFGVIDRIVPEPPGGAHTDPSAAADALKRALLETLDELDRQYGRDESLDAAALLDARYRKYRALGVFEEAAF